MGVERYEPRKQSVLHAALWRGKMADFVAMPDFNDLINRVLDIDTSGTLIMQEDQGSDVKDTRVDVGKEYIVRGVTGHFFVVEKEEFEETYQLIQEEDKPDDLPLDRL